MEASPYIAENSPRVPTVTCLREFPETGELVYHFFVDGREMKGVEAELAAQGNGDGQLTYMFYLNRKAYGIVEIYSMNGLTTIEYAGSDDLDKPEDPNLIALFSGFAIAAIGTDFPGAIEDEHGNPLA